MRGNDIPETKILPLLIKDLENELAQISSDLLLLITEEEVWRLYAEKIFKMKEGKSETKGDKKGEFFLAGKKVLFWVGPSGEKIKSFSSYEQCTEFFLSRGIHRKAHVVALGGGAVCDMAGFVASTLLRGVTFSVIPTTLLAMVDAAYGGKVAINSQHGKNLLGAFHFPQSLFLCEEFLETLPKREILCGKGEILKYAFLDPEVARLLEDPQTKEKELIAACLRFKSKIVAEDPWEDHLRRILNLGHTLGHALEKMFPISHGEAVLVGLFGILHYFIPRENFQVREKFSIYLKALGLSCEDLEIWTYLPTKKSFEDFFSLVGKDKKREDQKTINLVLLEKVGLPFVKEYTLPELREKALEFWVELNGIVKKRRGKI